MRFLSKIAKINFYLLDEDCYFYRQEQMKQKNAAMLNRITKIKKSVAAYYKDKYYIYYRYIFRYCKKNRVYFDDVRKYVFLSEMFGL